MFYLGWASETDDYSPTGSLQALLLVNIATGVAAALYITISELKLVKELGDDYQHARCFQTGIGSEWGGQRPHHSAGLCWIAGVVSGVPPTLHNTSGVPPALHDAPSEAGDDVASAGRVHEGVGISWSKSCQSGVGTVCTDMVGAQPWCTRGEVVARGAGWGVHQL
jgi:hypothetical protein